jgi:tetratricopeptide (TPR) repeat protein
MNWFLSLIERFAGHQIGFNDKQIDDVNKSLPASIELLNLLKDNISVFEDGYALYTKAQPIYQEADALYAKALPIYQQAQGLYTQALPVYTKAQALLTKVEAEWKEIGPAITDIMTVVAQYKKQGQQVATAVGHIKQTIRKNYPVSWFDHQNAS